MCIIGYCNQRSKTLQKRKIKNLVEYLQLMDIRELLQYLKKIRCWTFTNTMARNLLDELIARLENQLPK
jgi:hypothetical protein